MGQTFILVLVSLLSSLTGVAVVDGVRTGTLLRPSHGRKLLEAKGWQSKLKALGLSKGLSKEKDVCGYDPANEKNKLLFDHLYINQNPNNIPWNAGKGDDDFRAALNHHWKQSNSVLKKVMLKGKAKLQILEIGCGQGECAEEDMRRLCFATSVRASISRSGSMPAINTEIRFHTPPLFSLFFFDTSLSLPVMRLPLPPLPLPLLSFFSANDIKMVSKMGFTPTCVELSAAAVAQGVQAKIRRATFILGDVCTVQATNRTFDVICKCCTVMPR